MSNRLSWARLTRALLAAPLLAIGVGCATQNGSDLSAELEACRSARGEMESELGSMRAKLDSMDKEAEGYRVLLERRVALDRDLRNKLKSLVDAGQIEIAYRRGLMILKLPNAILFDTAKAKIRPEGAEVLAQVAGVLSTVDDRRMLVAGHTDTRPIKKNRKYPSNWELSTARATEVVKYLIAQGVPPTSVGAAGFSEYDPIAEGDGEEARQSNRRTEIVLIPNLEDVVRAEETAVVAPAQAAAPAPSGPRS